MDGSDEAGDRVTRQHRQSVTSLSLHLYPTRVPISPVHLPLSSFLKIIDIVYEVLLTMDVQFLIDMVPVSNYRSF